MFATCRAIAAAVALLLLRSANGSLPDDLSNYLNEYVCDTRVRLVRPETVADVQEAVKLYDRVFPVGTGNSWNKEFFCAEPDSDGDKISANIAMSTIRPLKIEVDEEDMSAWVSAGVSVWDLMSYLGNYVTERSPRGYALGAVSGYVNQTIAGAVATNTHGSSLQHGSLSNQAVGFEVVLANGTLVEIDPDRHPLLFRAFQVNVGRLGVVTQVKMRIIRETLARRTVRLNIHREEFMPMFREIQNVYRSEGVFPEWLQPEVLFVWNPNDFLFSMYTLEEVEETTPTADVNITQNITEAKAVRDDIEAKINAPIGLNRSEGDGKIADGVGWEVPIPFPPELSISDPANARSFIEAFTQGFLEFNGNTTTDYHEASVILPRSATENDQLLQDDYEVAVYIDTMTDCMEGLMNLAASLFPENGLRAGAPLRFEKKDNGLLSVSHDKPILWIDFADYIFYNQEPRASNVGHKKLMAYLVSNEACSPNRLHWGKAGFPDFGCWNGAEHYKDTWCDFGCVVRALDPEDKFIGSTPDRWNWNGANLETCCTEEGYDTSLEGCDCSVIPIRTPEQCPDAPFYTNR